MRKGLPPAPATAAPATAAPGGDDGAPRGGWGRLIRAPRKRKGHVLLDVCMPSGDVLSEAISPRAVVSPLAYRVARKARQGTVWPLDLRKEEVEEYEYEYYEE